MIDSWNFSWQLTHAEALSPSSSLSHPAAWNTAVFLMSFSCPLVLWGWGFPIWDDGMVSWKDVENFVEQSHCKQPWTVTRFLDETNTFFFFFLPCLSYYFMFSQIWSQVITMTCFPLREGDLQAFPGSLLKGLIIVKDKYLFCFLKVSLMQSIPVFLFKSLKKQNDWLTFL